MTVATGPIDRTTTVPFHLKLFYKTNSFHALSEFPATPTSTARLPPHLQIYTWPNLTLREASHLLLSSLPDLLPTPGLAIGTRLSFRLVYPSPSASSGAPPPSSHSSSAPRYATREIGSIVVGAAPEDGGEGGDADMGGTGEGEEEGSKTKGEGVAGMGGGTRMEGGDAGLTLAEARFVVGDWVDVCVGFPGREGGVAPLPVGWGSRGGGGGGVGGEGGGHRGRMYRDEEQRYGGGGSRGGRENGFGYGGYAEGEGGFGRGGGRGGGGGYAGRGGGGRGAGRLDGGGAGVPPGEWRRGERLPDVGYGGGRGGRGGGFRGRGGRGGFEDGW